MNWRNLSVGQEKYVRFSPACDFSGFLGNKGMGRKVILNDVPTQDLGAPTESVVEVEEAIAIDENDVGTNSQRLYTKNEVEDVEMMDTGTDKEPKSSSKRERTASLSPTPRKTRRSGNAKHNSTEETALRTPKPALTTRRTHPHVEVVISSRKAGLFVNHRKSESHVLVSESPISVKKTSPVTVKTSARKFIPAIDTDEEEEPVSTKRAPPKKPQRRKRHESESEEEQERAKKPTPGPSKPNPKPTQRPAQESSPAPDVDDAPARGRRSAARKADEKLRDIMPDVINFQKQMKRGLVVGDWEKAGKEQERVEKTKEKEREKLKENAREKVKETARRRRSDVR